MLTIRDATTEETLPYSRPGYDTWGAILEDDSGVRRGQIFLSTALGEVFGHSMQCESTDKFDAARLYSRARKKARVMGYEEFWVHIPEDDKSMEKFWKRLGFETQATLLKGKI